MTNSRTRSARSRSVTALSALALGAAALTACGVDSGGAGVGDAVVVAVNEFAVTDLNPGMSQGTNVDYAFFTPLTEYDAESGGVENAVAESVESQDQVHWTIKLRSGWTFHDGSPVTAQSFVDSWNLSADPANAMGGNTLMSVFEGYDTMNPAEGEPTATELSGVEAVDDLTIEVTLAEPNQLFPYVISSTYFSPVTEDAAADPEAYATRPVGNGPFELADEAGWQLGDQDISLRAYDDYAGEAPGVDAIDLRVYQDDGSVFTDFQAGQVDVALVEAGDVSAAQAEDPDSVVEVPFPAVVYLGFPLYDDRFADVEVRRAISMAIDREEIVAQLLDGHGQAATGLSPDLLVGADQVTCDACTYDPEAAAAALQAAGGFDGPLVLQTYSDATNEKVLQAIANQLSDNLGIEATVEATPISQLYEALRADSAQGPFLLYAGAAYPHVFAQANALMAEAGLLNVTTFSSSAFEEAMLAAKSASDPDEAAALAADAAQLGLDELPLTPIFFPAGGIVHAPEITGVSAEFLGSADLASLEAE